MSFVVALSLIIILCSRHYVMCCNYCVTTVCIRSDADCICCVKEIPKRYYCGELHGSLQKPYTTDNRNAFRRHLVLKHGCDLKPYSDEIEQLYGEWLWSRQQMCQRGQRHTRRRVTGQLSTPTVPHHTVASQPAVGGLQFVELHQPTTLYIRSISEAPTSLEASSDSVAAATSVTAASIATAIPSTPIPAGMECGSVSDDVDIDSLCGFQPSTQSNASNRPWLSPSRFLSSDVGIQAVQNHADNETQTVQNLTNNETQTDPFERTWRRPY